MRSHIATLCAVLVAAVVLSGCGAEILTVAATQAELQKQAAQSATRQLEAAGTTTGRIQAERAIQTYYAEKGTYPPSLQALVPNYLASVPTRGDGTPWGYDPTTGKLREARPAPQSAAPQPSEDQRNLQRIREAINQYGQATGYYPDSLEVLTPYYIVSVPKTQSGQPFVYNPATGQVWLPGQAAPSRNGAAGAGLGPAGQAMTGIGIQQQLGNQSSAGANSAGTRGRGSIDNTTSNYNQRAEEALGYLN